MKKLLIILVSMTVAGAAFAESDIDKGLNELGIVDDNYVYTDVELATTFFTMVTETYAKSLPMSFNRFIEINGLMMTPYHSYTNYRYTIPFDAEDRAMVKQDLASKQNLREICEDYFISETFMKANNFTMVYSYMDSDYRPLAKVTINNATYASALAP
ncbi:hypothetical protein [Psychrobacter sp. WY6]|uniref:hypothetical protein n=1 Tax=Psychrobacter sp. WY6 TaxID=2708350 RepID=UPI002022C3A7|nr:hypothetical protein [Psychrobacter sp. WY6]